MADEFEEYVLGSEADELKRLGLQHRLWSGYARDIWQRAEIASGMRVLDCGAGPGFATSDLAELVGESGHVTALECSPVFIEALKDRQAGFRSSVDIRQVDLNEVDLEEGVYDAAYIRWVLCFLEDPAKAIRNIAKGLKLGGRIAIQDYANFLGAITLYPRSEAFERLKDAFHDSWIASGGNSRVGIELPDLLQQSGFIVRDVRMVSLAVRPTDPMWQWPQSFFPIVAKSLVDVGAISHEDRDQFLKDWKARSQGANTLFCTPSMMEIVAEKASEK